LASIHLANFAWDKLECIHTKYSVGGSLREMMNSRLYGHQHPALVQILLKEDIYPYP